MKNNAAMCGGVKMFVMKHHTPLQAAASIQAHSKHLKVYAQIGLSERGKQSNTEVIADC